MGLGRKMMTGVAATAVAVAGLGVGAGTANAVPYAPGKDKQERVVGDPGCITPGEMKPFYINKNGMLIYKAVCDYRTSSGIIIEDHETGGWYAPSLGNVWKA